MSSKGKKGGKKKGQTLNLTEFLGGDGGGAYRAPGSGATTTVSMGSTWADEMDEEEMAERDRPKQQIVLPTAPRAALGPDIDDERIPHSPPFTAYIANLPYDVDEEAVKDVFVNCRLKILTVRLMKEEGGRLRGYGYADFADRDSLCDALSMTDLAVKSRKMKIDLPSGSGRDGDKGRGFSDRPERAGGRGGAREDDPDAGRSDTCDDWRSGPPPASRDSDRDRGRGGGGGGGGGGGFDRYEAPRDRGFSGFSRDDRDERGGGRSYGFGRDRDDRYGGDRRRSPEAPKERPKLNLMPRAKKDEDTTAKPAERAPEARPNIFGSAKPVDTTQREKEIEQKLGKMDVKEESDRPSAYRPPGARDRGEDRQGDDRRGGGYSRDDRRTYDRDHDRRDDRGYGRRDDRGYDKDRRDDRGYDKDRRDDRGYDRRDDRGYEREDGKREEKSDGSKDERRDGSGDERRDGSRDEHRDGSKDERRDGSRDERRDGSRDEQRDRSNDEKKNTSAPVMKKYEEPKAPELVGKNKFAYLQEEAGSASEHDE